MPIFDQAKNIIEYLARGTEFAAALIGHISQNYSVIETSPCRMAIVAASVRSETSNFSIMLLT